MYTTDTALNSSSFTVTSLGEETFIHITHRGQRSMSRALLSWLATGIIGAVWSSHLPILDIFWQLWLLSWALGGVLTLALLLWHNHGTEIITLTPYLFQLERRIGWASHTRVFAQIDMHQLHAAPTDSNATLWQLLAGQVVFTYRQRPFRFGSSLTAAESEELVTAILHAAPRLEKPHHFLQQHG